MGGAQAGADRGLVGALGGQHHQGHPRPVGADPARPDGRDGLAAWADRIDRSPAGPPTGRQGQQAGEACARLCLPIRVACQVPPPACPHEPAGGAGGGLGGREGARGARRQTPRPPATPPARGRAGRGRVAAAVAGGADVPGRRRGVRQTLRQRDHPHHRHRTGHPQTPGPAGPSRQRPTRPLCAERDRDVQAPGRGVARPDHRQPGGGLPHPPRPSTRPLVCNGRLAAGHPPPRCCRFRRPSPRAWSGWT